MLCANPPNGVGQRFSQDADLIMLSLATHEPHFKVLREDVFWNTDNNAGCRICGQPGHIAAECTGVPKKKQGVYDEKGQVVPRPYVWFYTNRLREALSFELRVATHNFPFDPERAIDDWVFLCFFVGNDFLPHLPSLEIREGAIDVLIDIYKRLLPTMDGYLTENGNVRSRLAQPCRPRTLAPEHSQAAACVGGFMVAAHQVNLSRVAMIMEELGRREEDIFRRRRDSTASRPLHCFLPEQLRVAHCSPRAACDGVWCVQPKIAATRSASARPSAGATQATATPRRSRRASSTSCGR